MRKVLAKLPGWLQGKAARIETQLADMVEHLSAQAEDSATKPFTIKQGREQLDCALLEIASTGQSEAVERFVADLLARLPSSSEIAVVTHSRPEIATQQPKPESDEGTARLHTLLRPVPGQNTREVRSYLLVRSLHREEHPNWLNSVCESAHGSAVCVRALSGPAAARVLLDWAGAHADESRTEGWSSIAAEPQMHARHPMGSWQFDAPLGVETWECVTLRAGVQGCAAAHVRTTALVKGLVPAARKTLHEIAKQYANHGLMPLRELQGKPQDVYPCLPWLHKLDRSTDRALKRKGCLLSSTEASRLLPLPAGASSLTLGEPRATSLRTLNNRGAVTHLGTWPTGYHNMMLLGTPGAGLTYLGNAILAAHLAGGGQAWAVRGQESQVFDEVAGAHKVTLVPGQPISLNPLYGLQSESDYYDARAALLAWVMALAEGNGADVPVTASDDGWHALSRALDTAWERVRGELRLSVILAELDHDCEAGRHLARTIRTKLEGLLPEWFKGPSAIDASAAYVSVDITGFSRTQHEHIIAATVLTLHTLETARLSRHRPKMLLVDEVGLLGDGAAYDLVQLALRRFRPLNGTAIFCSPPFSAKPDEQTSMQRVLTEYCANKVLMQGAHMGGWFEWGKNIFGRAGDLVRSSMSSSRFLWVQEQQRMATLLELELSPEAQVTFAPSHWQLKNYRSARAEGLTIPQSLARGTQAYSPVKGN
jgi:hypothetical protein